jgi:hypothetical protein
LDLLPHLKVCYQKEGVNNPRFVSLHKIGQHLEAANKISVKSLETVEKQLATVNMLTQTSGMGKNLMMDLLDLAQTENNTFKMN